MAMKKTVDVIAHFFSDGTATTASLDLLSDPYTVVAGLENWFTASKKAANPVDVVSIYSGITATLSGTVITFTWASAPAAGPQDAAVHVLFAA